VTIPLSLAWIAALLTECDMPGIVGVNDTERLWFLGDCAELGLATQDASSGTSAALIDPRWV